MEFRENTEKALQVVVNHGVITPITKQTEWVSSLAYPHRWHASPMLRPLRLEQGHHL